MAKAKRRRNSPYSGTLLRPIVVSGSRQKRHLGMDVVLITDETDKIEKAREGKWPELFAHFSIRPDDPNRWKRLARELAIEHVSGFRIVWAKGAPVIETADLLRRLHRLVIRRREELARRLSRQPTNGDVCRSLKRDPDFIRQFPQLSNVSIKRLQNLVSAAHGVWRDQLKAILD
jgi:hypothetical protein